MKKLLLLSLIALTLNFKSQIATNTAVTSSGTLVLISVQPGIVCACDSTLITVNFKWSGSIDTLSANTGFELFFNYYDYILNYYKYIPIRKLEYYEFTKMIKVAGPFVGDTLYSFWYRFPCNFVDKYAKIGDDQVLMNFSLNTYTHQSPVLVKRCNLTGIPSYNNDNSLIPVYYNLQGLIVEPKENELLIRQTGNLREKILIQN